MGHIRLKRLPATRKWGQVVALLASGALEALGHCRHAIIEAGVHLNPWSRQYELGGPVIKAIDDLAAELTGDPKYFHIGSSTR